MFRPWLAFVLVLAACGSTDDGPGPADDVTPTGGIGPGTGGTPAGAGSGGSVATGGRAQDGGAAGRVSQSGGSTHGGASNGGASGSGAANGGSANGGASGGGARPSTGGATQGGTTAGGMATNAGSAGEGGMGMTSGSAGAPAETTPRIHVFSRTTEYRHASIELAARALGTLAGERGWMLSHGEDAAVFTPATLAELDLVVFLSTSGDMLDASQQTAFEAFIRSGRSFVGIHAASASEYEWTWYGELVGAFFSQHPEIQAARVVVEDATHASTAHLPAEWERTDEWYNFRTNPRDAVHVLLRLDESSYSPGEGAMGDDHPIAWHHEYDGGRAFYTALGHTDESWTDPLFLQHVAGGIEWALGR